jgi:hypothetical protein
MKNYFPFTDYDFWRPGRALIKGIGSFPGRKAVLGPHVARSNPYSTFG